MNKNIEALEKAAEELGLSFVKHHASGNCVSIKAQGAKEPLYFVNWAHPFNSASVARLCSDKDYSYGVLAGSVSLPKTLAFLSPAVEEKYYQYRKYETVQAMADKVSEVFGDATPVVVKPNSGSHGKNIARCKTRDELLWGLGRIFNASSKDYDFVALVQEAIDIRAEYRVVLVHGSVHLAYLKDLSEAEFVGNISPLHWRGSVARKVKDRALLGEFETFLAPVHKRMPYAFFGCDVVRCGDGSLSLLEVNASPGFDYYIRDNGRGDIVELYKELLKAI